MAIRCQCSVWRWPLADWLDGRAGFWLKDAWIAALITAGRQLLLLLLLLLLLMGASDCRPVQRCSILADCRPQTGDL